MDWQAKARAEIARAEQARQDGKEGQMRVCSRRAAGWAAKAYLDSIRHPVIKTTGFQNILQVAEITKHENELQAIIYRLTTNLENVDETGEEIWPEDLDLIQDAKRMIKILFPESSV